MLFLKPNGGFRPVAAVNSGVFRQNEQFVYDIAGQLFVTSAGEVGAANASVEKHVAGNQDFVLRTVKNHAAGRMAGCFNNFKVRIAKRNAVAFAEKAFRSINRLHWNAKPVAVVRDLFNQNNFVGVSFEGQVIRCPAVRDAHDMIKMAVRVDQADRRQFHFGNKFVEFAAFVFVITSCVNNNALPGFVENHIGVFLNRVKREFFYLHESVPKVLSARSAQSYAPQLQALRTPVHSELFIYAF